MTFVTLILLELSLLLSFSFAFTCWYSQITLEMFIVCAIMLFVKLSSSFNSVFVLYNAGYFIVARTMFTIVAN